MEIKAVGGAARRPTVLGAALTYRRTAVPNSPALSHNAWRSIRKALLDGACAGVMPLQRRCYTARIFILGWLDVCVG